MSLEVKKEERSEYIAIWATPAVKKEFDLAKDNKTLQESIIRRFLQSEKSFLEAELQGIDEATIRYSAKLIGIKDKFSEVQDQYTEQIDSIYNKANETFKKIDGITRGLQSSTERAFIDVKKLSDSISYVNVERLERLAAVIEKYNAMSIDEKKLIKLLIGDKP
jgi:hypothetical protein